MKHRQIIHVSIVIAAVGFLYSGCGTVHVDESWSALELWEISKDTFEQEKYLDASELLTTFTLNHSGSTLIDSAQFFLAECHFMLKEYIIAEAEYARLVQNFPESPLVDDARFKIILCFFYLSPRYDLDQRNTSRTVMAITDFLDEYSETDLTVRLAVKPTAWQSFRQVLTLGLWPPPDQNPADVSLYRTRVVIPHRGINFGQWLLRVFTFGIYSPNNTAFKVPNSQVLDGDSVVQQALLEARSRLARKTYKSGELYYRMKKYPSAVIYFDTVIDQFDDTSWAAAALKMKGESYFAMHKYEEASRSYQRYLQIENAPDRDTIENRLRECQTQIQSASISSEEDESDNP
jgi:outer membrane protein assembly factor BamD (BamD/ComL family)